MNDAGKTRSRNKLVWAGGVLSICLAVSGAIARDATDRFADRVLTGGKLYTVNQSQPWAEAVAIIEGRITYVGDNNGAEAWIGPQTQIDDLNGKLVLPGLVDSHTHPGLIALFADATPIPDPDPEKILSWLKGYVDENPELPFVLAGSWRTTDFGVKGPHKKALDQIVNDRPVILMDDSGHSMWLNSKALEAMGVNRHTKDPAPGVSYFVRDENGEPTGWVKEFAAAPMLAKLLRPGENFETTLIAFLDYLAGQGVTTLYDGGNLSLDDEVYSVLSRLDGNGQLPLRYEGTYHIHLPDQFEKAVFELKRLRNTYGGDKLTFNTIKIHFDGVGEVRTSAVIEPFNDDPTNRGGTIVNEGRLENFIRELHREKIDLHIHVVGDRAIRMALNAFETVKTELGDQLYTRLTLCHLEVMKDEDISRFNTLGVVANYTPHWHGDHFQGGDATLGERNRNKMRAQPLLRDGAMVTFSSDVVTPDEFERANPYLGMQVAHNRQDLEGGKDAPVMPPLTERLSLEDLIRGYTYNGAYQLRMDNLIGSIEVGKSADLVVLNHNLFEMDRYDIHKAKVAMTLMEGETIYERNWKVVLAEWYYDLVW